MSRCNCFNHQRGHLVSIASIGDAVHQWLNDDTTPVLSGCVHSVFHRSCYLQFEPGLVCLGLSEIGDGPLNLLLDRTCSALPPSLLPEARVSLSMSGLHVGAAMATGVLSLDTQNHGSAGTSAVEQGIVAANDTFFDLYAARIFFSKLASYTVNAQQLKSIRQTVMGLALPSDGLAPLLYTQELSKTEDSVLLQFCRPAVGELLAQLPALNVSAHDTHKPSTLNHARQWLRLVGAGPGLTPSGDDFISGTFCALHVMNEEKTAVGLWHTLSSVARTNTTEVSVALLEQAATGRVGKQLHSLIKELLGNARPSTNKTTALLSELGETSGYDWLAGFVLSLEALSAEGIHGGQPDHICDHKIVNSPGQVYT